MEEPCGGFCIRPNVVWVSRDRHMNRVRSCSSPNGGFSTRLWPRSARPTPSSTSKAWGGWYVPSYISGKHPFDLCRALARRRGLTNQRRLRAHELWRWVLPLNLRLPLPNKVPNGGHSRIKLLNHIALAAVVAVSVGFLGACAEVPAQTTTTTEYSTSAPGPVYVAPPVTTGSTTTTQYPNGTVTSTTPGYTSVVTSPSVVMVPSSAAAETTKTTVYDDGVVQKKVTTTDYDTYDSTDDPAEPEPAVQVAPAVVQPVPSQTTTSTSWGNGATEQKRTTTSVDGSVQNQTTTTWNGNGDEPSQTTTTTTNNP